MIDHVPVRVPRNSPPRVVRARLVGADSSIRSRWDSIVQPVIDLARVSNSLGPSQIRPDYGWRWSNLLHRDDLRGNIPGAALAAAVLGQSPAALGLMVEGHSTAVAVALALVCDSFDIAPGQVAFVWYFSTAPDLVTSRELGFQVGRIGTAMMYALVRRALVRATQPARMAMSTNAPLLLLHASPLGGDGLMEFYLGLGMLKHSGAVSATRKNDGRYLTFTRHQAETFEQRERGNFR